MLQQQLQIKLNLELKSFSLVLEDGPMVFPLYLQDQLSFLYCHFPSQLCTTRKDDILITRVRKQGGCSTGL